MTLKLPTHNKQAGFTLVELLVVIVIIGILGGIIIGVLNPLQQQRRARDGVTKAQIEKMALSAKSLYVSSPRKQERSPSLQEFAQGFASSDDIATNCASTAFNTTEQCLFTMTTQPLISTCSGDGYSNDNGSTQCNYVYWRAPDAFMIAARGVATPTQMFVYSYQEDVNVGNVTEGFYACPVNFTVGSGIPATCTRLQ